jgi:hypothetical protein
VTLTGTLIIGLFLPALLPMALEVTFDGALVDLPAVTAGTRRKRAVIWNIWHARDKHNPNPTNPLRSCWLYFAYNYLVGIVPVQVGCTESF